MKRYSNTEFIPGDIFLAKDGSIGVICEAHIRVYSRETSTIHRRWNEPDSILDNLECFEEVEESYSCQRIPGFPCSKGAWWNPREFEEVLKGPLHQILNGEVKLKRKKLAAAK
jgi:hypothetical protein